jgi:hypothetical protein
MDGPDAVVHSGSAAAAATTTTASTPPSAAGRETGSAGSQTGGSPGC